MTPRCYLKLGFGPLEPAAQGGVVLALDIRQGEALLRSVHAAAGEARAGSRSQRHVETDDVTQVLTLEEQLTSTLIDERRTKGRRVRCRKRRLVPARAKLVHDRRRVLKRRRRSSRDVRLGDDELRLGAARDADWRAGTRVLVL